MDLTLPGDQATREQASRGIVIAARIGYAAKAAVYAMLGVLSLMAALGIAGGKLTDSKGALRTLGEQPFGNALLWASAAGLLCYGLWQLVRALFDPERHGAGGKAWLLRTGYAVSAGAHAMLATYAAQLAWGSHPSSSGTQTSVAKALTYPAGSWLVAAIGVIAVGFGIAQIVRAARGKVGKQYAHAELPPRLCRAVRRVARVGCTARGLVFLVVGGSLVAAAARRDPERAHGFAEALGRLTHTPLGVSLLAFVAAGLVMYGIHLVFMARWGYLPEPE